MILSLIITAAEFSFSKYFPIRSIPWFRCILTQKRVRDSLYCRRQRCTRNRKRPVWHKERFSLCYRFQCAPQTTFQQGCPGVWNQCLSENSRQYRWCGNTIFCLQVFWIGKCSPQLRRIFNQLVSENSKTGLWRESILSALTLQMITEMTRLYYPDNASSLLPPEDCDLNENRSWILDTLLLEDCSDVTLNDFARGMGVSPRQAERIIKDYYGSSFRKLRYESKMAMAASLLESENITINECAAKCGYTSLSSFAAAFRRKFNISPNEYKNL